jgi:hypothetical protein
MHKGVLRDIQREEEEKRQRAAAGLAAAAPASASDRACEGDICDLAQTRFRDPATGQVYVPAAPVASGALR